MYKTDSFEQNTSAQCYVHGFAAYGIQVVSGTEILLGITISRSTKDNFDATEPKDSPGESMGGFEGLRPPACTKLTVFN